MGWLDQALSDQFYRWELRGRGWQLYDAPVSIEPPFRPFFGHFVAQDGAQREDDGKRPTFGSRLFEGARRMLAGQKQAPANEETADEDDEPGPFYEERGDLVELQLTLPEVKGLSQDVMESWLLSLSSCRDPVAFEVVGSESELVAQFAASPGDATLLDQQIEAHFPAIQTIAHNNYLREQWREAGPELVAIEFGLTEMFMVSLAKPRSDIFVSMTAAMADLAPDELAVFQVIFEPVRHAWAESILRSVTDNRGGSFFANRPDLVKQARDKISAPLFAAVVRIAVFADEKERARDVVLNMASCLRAFTKIGGNDLKPLEDDEYPHDAHEDDVLRRQSRRPGMLLNAEELTGFVHLPTSAVVASKLRRDTGRSRPAPVQLTEEADLLLGFNQHAGQEAHVWLQTDHRIRHMHILGGSGYGKTTFLFNCIRQDIENGHGCGLLDPHGDLADRLLDFIPRERLDDVVLIDPTDEEASVGFNILAAHSDFEKDLIASDLVAVFRRQSTSWGDQMESVLHHAILAFLESRRGGTIADLKNFLLDSTTRTEFLRTVEDPDVVFYWKRGFPQLGGTRSIGPVVTRLEKLLSRKPVKRMVSQQTNKLDFADILDSGRIFIAKLPQGQIGAENAFLLGTLLVSKFQQMAMARQRLREEERRPFFLYVDEAANFLTPSMAEILSGARKYRLGLILAHQSLSQLKTEPQVAAALDASACTRVAFRVSDQDARALAEGFSHFEARDLQNLAVGEAICRVERSDADFNLSTPPAFDDFPETEYSASTEVVAESRATYGTPLNDVDEMLRRAAREVPDIVEIEDEEEPPPPKRKARPPLPEEDEPPPVAAEPQAEEILAPPPKRAPKLPQELGRGGEVHRSTQYEFKALAESLGFRATIEKQLPGSLDSTDLFLERDGTTIAVEITVTNTLDYELLNIAKCLGARVSEVAVVSMDDAKLAKIKAAATNAHPDRVGTQIHFFTKDGFIRHIQDLAIASPPTPPPDSAHTMHKGWRVKTSVASLSPEEAKEREAAAAKILADSIRRKRSSPQI